VLDEDDRPGNAKPDLTSEIDGSDSSAKSDDTGCGSKSSSETSDTEVEDPRPTVERTMTPSKLHGKRRHSETAPTDGAGMSPKETSSPKLRNTYDTRSMRPKETFPRPNGSQGPLLRKKVDTWSSSSLQARQR
jgi:hypothetical protein